jgi:7-carboxy-7-deazaguanine synthase
VGEGGLMKINEIFRSIQGESTYQGRQCTFIRFAGCNLRCSYCDTTYAYEEGVSFVTQEVLLKVRELGCPLVEITGGEPLLQEEVYELIAALLEEGYQVLLETNGSIDIGKVDPRVVKIVDIKCPDSKMSDKINWENLKKLAHWDEVKFVISSRGDYEWAKSVIAENALNRATILMSPAFGRLSPQALSEWLLNDGEVDARLQLQLHKYLFLP